MTVTGYATEQQAIMSRLDIRLVADGDRLAERGVRPGGHGRVRGAGREPPGGVQGRHQLRRRARVRHPGLLTLNVRVPVNVGDGARSRWRTCSRRMYRDVTVDGSIHFKAPTVRDLGAEGAWYRVQVDCPYWRDSIF
jgi:hypothetical protein